MSIGMWNTYVFFRNFIWNICLCSSTLIMKCPKCNKEMDIVSEGVTNNEWYTDGTCKPCETLKTTRIRNKKNGKERRLENQ